MTNHQQLPPPPPTPGAPPYAQPQQPGYYPAQTPQPGYQQPQQAPGYPPPAQGYPGAIPAQQPGHPPQPPGYPPQQQGQMPPAPQAPVGPPPAFAMDENAAQAALQASEAEFHAKSQVGDPFAQWLKIPAPQGQTKWDHTVPPGTEGYVDVFICPPWMAGIQLPFAESVTHFWKSIAKPNGAVESCCDDDSCLICQGRAMGLESADPNVNRQATMWGKKRRQYIYNVIDLNNPQAHIYKDGKMRPFLFGAGSQLQKDLRELMKVRGVKALCDWQQFKPVRIKKIKTGPEDMNVEYSAIDLEPMRLPDVFFSAMAELWDLSEHVKPSSHEALLKAVLDMGLPLPGHQQVAPAPASAAHFAAPAPAYPNPYQTVPAAPHGVPAAVPPAGLPPMPPAVPPGVPPQAPANVYPAPQSAGVPPLPGGQAPAPGSLPPLPALPGAQHAPVGANAAVPGGHQVPPPPGARSF
jgi:hypothetical protein